MFTDLRNRPYIRMRTGDKNLSTGIFTLQNGNWVEKGFIADIKTKYPGFTRTRQASGWHSTKTAFDAENHLYTCLAIQCADKSYHRLLLYSRNGGDSYQVYELPLGRGVHDIEHWTGHNVCPGPPPVILYSFTGSHPARFCSFHDLFLLFPRKTEAGLDLGEPILVTRNCFGTCQHSGKPAPTVTLGDRTHIVWGEIDDSGVPGVPTYAATYLHREKRMTRKVLLGYGPPVNDVHNAPGICADSRGYLHVMTGAHGAPFYYLRSRKPNDALSGWTDPVPVCKTGYVDDKSGPEGRGRQTYLSLQFDSHDTLHTAFRQWRRNVDPYFGGQIYAALSYQRKPRGRPWEKARPLIVPPLPRYSIYYHNLTHDRRDSLYLSYSYYSVDEAYRNDIPGQYDYRAVITSPDGGTTWKLLETADFE